MLLRAAGPVEKSPLAAAELPLPEPGAEEMLIRVRACGVCHTDLHTVEGEIKGRLPVVPGHQIVGVVEKAGAAVASFRPGDRVGVPWLHRTCGACAYCRSDRENLCDRARFTGLDVNGGYAEFAVAHAAYAVKIPDAYPDAEAAPLLCAGIVGFRALRLAVDRPPAARKHAAVGQEPDPPPRPATGRLGLYGFGGSAHLAVQVAARWGYEVWVATRSAAHQRLARDLGAVWTGRAEDVPAAALDAAVMFAPAGGLVPEALRSLRRGGTLVLAGIYMTPVPELPYDLLYHERTIRSVANATRDDARQFLRIAGETRLRTEVETFPLEQANEALAALKHSRLRAAAVLIAG
jgi:propanol-preferring alcohol dehydrogenase